MRLKPRSILPRLTQLLIDVWPALAKAVAAPRLMVFDCEIKRAPQCSADWRDYKRLGLSVFGCYCGWLPDDQQWQAFTEDNNFSGVQDLIDQAEVIVGYNSLRFDDPLCEAHGIHIQTTFDLMVEVRRAAGEPLFGPCTPGYKLLHLAESNLGEDLPQVLLKSDTSPIQVPDFWRAGERERVIKYCLNDVYLTLELYKRRHNLADPVKLNRRLMCDPVATNWREIASTASYLFEERVFNASTSEAWHWSGARIVKARLAVAESAVLSFPIWMLPLKTWRQYTGVPFQKSSAEYAKSDRERELDIIYKYPTGHLTNKDGEDADPIPF